MLLIFLVSSCSTAPSNNEIDTKKPITTETKKEIPLLKTAEETLALAQSLNNKIDADSYRLKINDLLVQASELFLQQKNYDNALWLSNKTSKFVKDNTHAVYRLLLVKAASLQALNHNEQALQQLKLAEQLVVLSNKAPSNTNKSLTLTLPYYQTLSAALFTQDLIPEATSASLTAFSINHQATEQDIKLIWQQFSLLSPWQLPQLAKEELPFFYGWQQLLSLGNKYGDKQQEFSQHLALWQQSFPTHPAQVLIPSLKQTEFKEPVIQNIAVILPLTGKQKKVGLVAQQGILTAYQNTHDRKLHFIDSNQLEWSLLTELFTSMGIDHVIGPLLKSNVKNHLAQSEQDLALQIPTLLLNVPKNKLLTPYQIALSMQPEDEAIQAATTLSQQNYLNPIVLSYQDSSSKRIAQTFQKQWQKLTGEEIELFYVDKGRKMQASLKASLDVDASQSRIRTLTWKLHQIIKTETRNRRDIDMIYVSAPTAQTRLIKPYIDVYTSRFAKVIPVFASSRSHSYFDSINNKNINDLQGLTFTEMPWLLNSTQQNKPLVTLSKKLWPRQKDNLAKIFAMGFDSYNLLDQIPLMQQAPYIRYFGQTGTLKITEKNILTRSLIWGQYQKNKVNQVDME